MQNKQMKLPKFDKVLEYNKWNDDLTETASAEEREWFLNGWEELADFLSSRGNRTCGGGLYRTHNIDSGNKWTRLLEGYYPEFKNRIRAFAYDWEGNMMVQRRMEKKA
jgi:hypothetical protein